MTQDVKSLTREIKLLKKQNKRLADTLGGLLDATNGNFSRFYVRKGRVVRRRVPRAAGGKR